MQTTLKLKAARRAATKAMKASAARDEAIREAHREGASIRAIAEMVGLSHTRVHQILRNP